MPTSPNVTVVSVTGRAGLPPAPLARLERIATVDTVARAELPALTHAEAVRILDDADVAALTPKVTPVMNHALLAELPRLRAIALHATGVDMYDLTVLAEHDVAVTILPEYGTVSVAEHAMALLLSISRRVHLANDKARGLVPPTTSMRGFELSGRRLGIIGYGRIGSYVGRLARAFGMQVVAHDPYIPPPEDVELLALPELLATSDAVVVACSREYGAPPLLGPDELSTIPAGGVLVVVSRAAVVDTRAAMTLVRGGHLRGYAVDDVVTDDATDGDLLREGRVVQTGHSAWWSDEVLARGARQWVEAMHGLVAGGPLSFAVRPARWRPLREAALAGR